MGSVPYNSAIPEKDDLGRLMENLELIGNQSREGLLGENINLVDRNGGMLTCNVENFMPGME